MPLCRRQIESGLPRVVQFSRRSDSIQRCKPSLPHFPTSSSNSSRVDHHHRLTEGATTTPCPPPRFLRKEILRDPSGIMDPSAPPERRFSRDGRTWTGSNTPVWQHSRGFLLGSGNNHPSSSSISSSKDRLHNITTTVISRSNRSITSNPHSISTKGRQ